MKKMLSILLIILAFGIGILSFNFFTQCGMYGGIVGTIQRCECSGVEVPHPLNLFETRPGFSSTMCVGVQKPLKADTSFSKKDPRCLEKIDSGPCRAVIPAYEYNVTSQTCEKGVWGGCQGNVPFKTMDSCKVTCEATKY